MELFPITGKDILNRLGIVRNELLAFVIISCVILNAFALTLDSRVSNVQMISGVVMHLATIPILLGFGCFYCYAITRLPSSAQELVFVSDAKEVVLTQQARKKSVRKSLKKGVSSTTMTEEV